MIENTNVQTQHRQKQFTSYTLANGQRVPVLFRLKNVQASNSAIPRVSDSIAPVADAAIAVDLATDTAPNVTLHAATEKKAGPSWLKRNAYRGTVLILLIATVLLLNNNRSQSLPKSIANIDTTLSQTIAVAQNDEAKLQTTEAPKVEQVVAPDAPVLAQASSGNTALDVPKSSATSSKSGPTVQVTATDSSTLFLISESKESDSATSASLASNQSEPFIPAQATLLAPKVLDEGDTVGASIPATLLSTNTAPVVENQTVSVTNPNVNAATETTTDVALAAPTSASNRYPTATTPNNAVLSTSSPDLDPSQLFKLAQGIQDQSTEQTIRAMRQASTNQAVAPQWQAVPVSGPTSAPASPANSYTGSTQLYTEPSAVGQPNATTPKTPYVPLYTDASAPTNSLLNQAATTQNVQAASVPQRPTAYQPLYPSLNPGTTMPYSAPSQNGYDSQLYETADQSVGFGSPSIQR